MNYYKLLQAYKLLEKFYTTWGDSEIEDLRCEVHAFLKGE